MLIAGLPLTAWLLLAAAVIPGVALQLAHHRRRLRQFRATPPAGRRARH